MGWGGCGKDWGAGGAWGAGGFGGGGCGKGTMGKSYGGGKGGGCSSNWGGCGVWNPMFNPMMMMMMKGKGKGADWKNGLKSYKADKKVFVTGLPANSMSKEMNMKLKDHMSSTGATCLYAEFGNSGTGGAAFRTSEEAMMAAASLNGSTLEGYTLQCDMWNVSKKPTA